MIKRLLVFFFLPTVCLAGSQPRFYCGVGAHLFEKEVISLIDSAQSRIWAALFRLTAAPCMHALVRAKKRGVDVQIILDKGMLSVPAYKVLRRHAQEAGIPLWWSKGRGLMHHKWAVFDNKVLLGSLNWTRAGLSKNHEASLVCEDPGLVVRYVSHFAFLKKRHAGVACHPLAPHTELFFLPYHSRALRQRLSDLLGRAQSSIFGALYVLRGKWFIDKLTAALARGVRVQLVLDGSDPHNERVAKELRKAGADVRLYKAGSDAILHDKCVVVDDTVVIGSMNWTGAGTRINEEDALFVESAPLAAEVKGGLAPLF